MSMDFATTRAIYEFDDTDGGARQPQIMFPISSEATIILSEASFTVGTRSGGICKQNFFRSIPYEQTTADIQSHKTRPKKTHLRGRRSRHRRNFLPMLPVEIILQIFSYFTPPDVINFSSASVQLRQTYWDNMAWLYKHTVIEVHKKVLEALKILPERRLAMAAMHEMLLDIVAEWYFKRHGLTSPEITKETHLFYEAFAPTMYELWHIFLTTELKDVAASYRPIPRHLLRPMKDLALIARIRNIVQYQRALGIFPTPKGNNDWQTIHHWADTVFKASVASLQAEYGLGLEISEEFGLAVMSWPFSRNWEARVRAELERLRAARIT